MKLGNLEVLPTTLPSRAGGDAVPTAPVEPAASDLRRLVGDAPGLDTASREQIDQLIEELAQGSCAVDALTNSVGQINRQTLLYLVRAVGSC